MKTIHLIGCVKRDIMRWVNRHSNGAIELSSWYCGVTHHQEFKNLENYLKEKGITNLCFRKWLANDSNGSQEVLKFFMKNGMKNKPAKAEIRHDARFVFIFKINESHLDEVLRYLG